MIFVYASLSVATNVDMCKTCRIVLVIKRRLKNEVDGLMESLHSMT